MTNTLKKLFSTTPPVPVSQNNTQVATPTQKTKEELKIEALMSQWPEIVKNPPKHCQDLQMLKRHWEHTYKFHQGDKKQLYYFDLPEEIYRDVNNAFIGVQTTDAIADFFLEHDGFITDDMIISKFVHICGTHRDLTPEFYDIIIPRVKQVLMKADRQGIMRIARAAIGAANVSLGDKEFWEMIEFKLVNERLHRYLLLDDAVHLAYILSYSAKGSRNLLKLLEVNFIKHRKGLALNKKLVTLVRDAYQVNKLGSETLFAALDDPNIEVPGVDGNIPKMDRLNNSGKRLAIFGDVKTDLKQVEYKKLNH